MGKAANKCLWMISKSQMAFKASTNSTCPSTMRQCPICCRSALNTDWLL